MPKKAFKKKKQYQAHCQAKAKAGLLPDHQGNWVSRITEQSMQRDYFAGYKMGR